MIGHIETACFHCSSGREMIYASNRTAEWIHYTSDIRICFGKLFDKESGNSVVLLSPIKTGMLIVISKIIPNRSGDNLTAYLHVPFGIDTNGKNLKGKVFDVISALEKNRRDIVSACLNTISEEEFNIITNTLFLDIEEFGNKFAFRKVSSTNLKGSSKSLDEVLDNLYQDYYSQYKYIFLAIDGQHIAKVEQYADLSNWPIRDWRLNSEINNNTKVLDDDNKHTKDNIYEKIEESTNAGSPLEYTSDWLKSNTEIHGWLSFFFFAILLGGLISAIYPIITFNSEDYAGNFCLGAVDIITGLTLFCVAIYTIFCFTKRAPNAVFWGRIYVVLVFLTNLFSLIGGYTEETGLQSTQQVIKGVVWGGIWFLYLAYSTQVQEIIPKTYRKISKIDKGLLAGIVIIPVFLFIIGYIQINSLVDTRTKQETELKNKELAYNERTDGRVVFTIPDGFNCENNDVDLDGTALTVFSLNNDDIGNCTICSDYDTDKSEANFDSYWNNWKDDDIKNYSTDNVDRGRLKINGNDCLYRITKHYVNGVYVYWRYYLLFNDKTGKVFLASFYDTNNFTNYVNELLESVKFE